MQKPKKRKYPRKPAMPKGGIKTERQLQSYEERCKAYNKKVAEIESEYAKKMKDYTAFQKKVEKAKSMLK